MCRPSMAGLCLLLTSPAPAAGLVGAFLSAADHGHCIESVTFDMIRAQGPVNAAVIVRAALSAHALREQQQMTLGCDGDIAAQAIAAGADPEQVLKATAAGL